MAKQSRQQDNPLPASASNLPAAELPGMALSSMPPAALLPIFGATPAGVLTAQQLFLQEAEPTARDIASEQRLIDHDDTTAKEPASLASPPTKVSKNRAASSDAASSHDLLTNYMQQLSHIPLFSASEELHNARLLEQHERRVWQEILAHPKAVEHLHAASHNLEPSLQHELENLRLNYERAAARRFKSPLGIPPGRQRRIDQLAAQLRFADFDKELLEQVMGRVRKEVWRRRVIVGNPTFFRLTHAHLTAMEQARGTALRARNDFVRANLRLVVSVARRFFNFKISFIDLIQEGNVGLMKAVHRYDHRRGFRFSTYAHWWIRQSIERAIINKGNQVRLPVHVIDARRQVGRATAALRKSLGRAPSNAEISAALNVDLHKVEEILAGVIQDPVSLDETLGEHDPRRVLDMLRDDNVLALDEALIRENTHERVRELLQMLNPIEKDIIRRRFGLGSDANETLDDIGKIYNLSRERVRQIQAQGLMKMRRMCERRSID